MNKLKTIKSILIPAFLLIMLAFVTWFICESEKILLNNIVLNLCILLFISFIFFMLLVGIGYNGGVPGIISFVLSCVINFLALVYLIMWDMDLFVELYEDTPLDLCKILYPMITIGINLLFLEHIYFHDHKLYKDSNWLLFIPVSIISPFISCLLSYINDYDIVCIISSVISIFIFILSIFILIRFDYPFIKKEDKRVKHIYNRVPLTQEEIRFNEINNLFIDLDNHLEEKTEYGDSFNRLNEYEKVVYVFNAFVKESYNGGFEQFLFNSSGAYFKYLKETLIEINALNILGIYKEVFDIFPEDLPSEERKRDEVLFKIFNDELSEKLLDMDKEFYNINEMNVQEIVYIYYNNNKEYFDFKKE